MSESQVEGLALRDANYVLCSVVNLTEHCNELMGKGFYYLCVTDEENETYSV